MAELSAEQVALRRTCERMRLALSFLVDDEADGNLKPDASLQLLASLRSISVFSDAASHTGVIPEACNIALQRACEGLEDLVPELLRDEVQNTTPSQMMRLHLEFTGGSPFDAWSSLRGRPGFAPEFVDMMYLVAHYIRDCTAYVLKLGEEAEVVVNVVEAVSVTTMDVGFAREGMWLELVLRQILADIGRIPDDPTILTRKNYVNFSGLDSGVVMRLQSLSAVLSGYFCVEGADTDRQLAHQEEAAFLVGDDEWKQKHDVNLLRGIEKHFERYPDARYAARTQEVVEDIHTADIETLLSALERCG